MTKQDLAEAVSAKTSITQSDATIIIDVITESIKEFLIKGQPLYIRNFGTFSPVLRKAKVGRDIRHNKQVNINACYKPKFKPCVEFVNAMKSLKVEE